VDVEAGGRFSLEVLGETQLRHEDELGTGAPDSSPRIRSNRLRSLTPSSRSFASPIASTTRRLGPLPGPSATTSTSCAARCWASFTTVVPTVTTG